MTTAYPLSWPEGLARTQHRATSAFKTPLAGALENVRRSIEAFGRDTGTAASGIVLSSNVTLGAAAPADTGVAAWFTWDGAQRCIAVDRYPKVQDNLQAIHHILEARRTEMRHGGLHIVRQTFKGFVALPAPVADDWRKALRFEAGARPSLVQIKAAYRAAARSAHPNVGGDRAAWDALVAAYEAAKAAAS
ncbi:J domain-containing protein [Sphingomonas bacterium]|uniref:J domain-containing protein n=1 Tax=Sphingomonas bacterium TaxID=1895847 RepID=UPI001576415B|nr:J domain-containing protein [Sphingomonas bacterium]